MINLDLIKLKSSVLLFLCILSPIIIYKTNPSEISLVTTSHNFKCSSKESRDPIGKHWFKEYKKRDICTTDILEILQKQENLYKCQDQCTLRYCFAGTTSDKMTKYLIFFF